MCQAQGWVPNVNPTMTKTANILAFDAEEDSDMN
jgi:hypothetical protein